jgi:transposase
MMPQFGLRDDQWERIEDLLPGREGSVEGTAADNRLFVEAVLYSYRTGMPWRDLPERSGDGVQVRRRFSRWADSGERYVGLAPPQRQTPIPSHRYRGRRWCRSSRACRALPSASTP